MSTSKPRQRGFTLIELIIFIVVVSVGMVGILQVMNTVVKSSADPMVRKQAMALAESILEEIMLKEHCDPDTATLAPPASPVCPASRVGADQETLRADYDDVDDYNGQTKAVFLDWPASLSSYSVAITVAPPATISGVPMKQVTVAVTGGGNTVSLTGYRANY
jgi:MSHA pilin protein MshD